MPKNVDHVDVMLFIGGIHPLARSVGRSNERTDRPMDGPSVLRPFVLLKSDAVDLASVRTSKEHFEALHTESIRYLLPVASPVLLGAYLCVCVCV